MTELPYQVTVVVEGALDYETAFADSDNAYSEANAQADECEALGVEYAVYVLEGDIQYATSHKPYRSGGGAK